MTKVLIIDDSALMRRAISQALNATGDFTVAVARDGEDGLRRIHEFDPDVVTLDINMPVMDGMTCLSRIMVECPKPVVMVSSLTNEGALATLEALELGAVDYICKPGGTVSLNMHEVFGHLIEKLRAAAGARIRRTRGLTKRIASRNRGALSYEASATTKSSRTPQLANLDQKKSYTPETFAFIDQSSGPKPSGAVLIGVSTGGPRTLEEILPYLPADFPLPVLVCQHMPSGFTAAFAARLQKSCAMDVVEVSTPLALEPGRIYIGQGDADLVISKRNRRLFAVSMPSDLQQLWHPSVDILVTSAMASFAAKNLIAVQLTGMGYDGAEAMTALHQKGGYTIAESEETAIVFGMPHELVKRNGASTILPCHEITDELVTRAAKIVEHQHRQIAH